MSILIFCLYTLASSSEYDSLSDSESDTTMVTRTASNMSEFKDARDEMQEIVGSHDPAVIISLIERDDHDRTIMLYRQYIKTGLVFTVDHEYLSIHITHVAVELNGRHLDTHVECVGVRMANLFLCMALINKLRCTNMKVVIRNVDRSAWMVDRVYGMMDRIEKISITSPCVHGRLLMRMARLCLHECHVHVDRMPAVHLPLLCGVPSDKTRIDVQEMTVGDSYETRYAKVHRNCKDCHLCIGHVSKRMNGNGDEDGDRDGNGDGDENEYEDDNEYGDEYGNEDGDGLAKTSSTNKRMDGRLANPSNSHAGNTNKQTDRTRLFKFKLCNMHKATSQRSLSFLCDPCLFTIARINTRAECLMLRFEDERHLHGILSECVDMKDMTISLTRIEKDFSFLLIDTLYGSITYLDITVTETVNGMPSMLGNALARYAGLQMLFMCVHFSVPGDMLLGRYAEWLLVLNVERGRPTRNTLAGLGNCGCLEDINLSWKEVPDMDIAGLLGTLSSLRMLTSLSLTGIRNAGQFAILQEMPMLNFLKVAEPCMFVVDIRAHAPLATSLNRLVINIHGDYVKKSMLRLDRLTSLTLTITPGNSPARMSDDFEHFMINNFTGQLASTLKELSIVQTAEFFIRLPLPCTFRSLAAFVLHLPTRHTRDEENSIAERVVNDHAIKECLIRTIIVVFTDSNRRYLFNCEEHVNE